MRKRKAMFFSFSICKKLVKTGMHKNRSVHSKLGFLGYMVQCVLTVQLLFSFAGCSIAISTIFLQSLEVTGPLVEPPLTTVNDSVKKGIRVIPHVSRLSTRSVKGIVGEHTKVNDKGVYQVDTVWGSGQHYPTPSTENIYSFSDKNFGWRFPEYSFGADVVFPLSDDVTLLTGIGYATTDGKDFFVGNFGFSYSTSWKIFRARVALGFQWYSLQYETEFVEVVSYPLTWRFFLPAPHAHAETAVYFEGGRRELADLYLSLFASVQLPNTPLSGFLQYDFTNRTLLQVRQPSQILNNLDFELRSPMTTVTPGVSLDVSERARLVAGLRYTSFSGINKPSKNVLLTPIVKWELIF